LFAVGAANKSNFVILSPNWSGNWDMIKAQQNQNGGALRERISKQAPPNL